MAGLLNLAGLDELAGRFGKHDHSRDRENDLEGKGESPRHGVILDEVKAQIDLEGNGNTDSDEDAVRHHIRASLV